MCYCFLCLHVRRSASRCRCHALPSVTECQAGRLQRQTFRSPSLEAGSQGPGASTRGCGDALCPASRWPPPRCVFAPRRELWSLFLIRTVSPRLGLRARPRLIPPQGPRRPAPATGGTAWGTHAFSSEHLLRVCHTCYSSVLASREFPPPTKQGAPQPPPGWGGAQGPPDRDSLKALGRCGCPALPPGGEAVRGMPGWPRTGGFPRRSGGFPFRSGAFLLHLCASLSS